MPDSARERYRRAALRLPQRGGGERTGHAAMFAAGEVVSFEPFLEGGGFPRGFLEFAHRTLGCDAPAEVLHICSGSVRAPYSVDRRLSVRPAVVADARALPFRNESFRWAIADPPYSRTWAKVLYGIPTRQYPTPGGIVREACRVLHPGGRLGLLHYQVPLYAIADLRMVGVWGITLGPGSSIRAWTVLEKVPSQAQLTYALEAGQPLDKAPVAIVPGAAAPDETSPHGRPYGPPDETSLHGRCACGCGRPLTSSATGRPRRFATAACREAARLRRERGLPEDLPRSTPGGRRRLDRR